MFIPGRAKNCINIFILKLNDLEKCRLQIFFGKCFQRIHIFLVISLNSEHGKRSLLNPYVKYFGILNSTNYFSLFCNVFVLTFICIICHVIFANVIQIVSFLINAILTYLLKIRREKDSCNSKWLSQVEQLNQTAHVLWEMIFIYLH